MGGHLILLPAWTLGSLTFGAATLAWGALACAVPVVIHLALRQRARRQVFPALRFLLDSHPVANRAQRLKHLLLMAMRMLVILLLVALLADARYSAGGADPFPADRATGPVSAVFCLDDSAGMGYRFRGQMRLERAVSAARLLVADSERFPAGSEFALVTGSSVDGGLLWARSRTAVRATLESLEVADHDRSVSFLLERAYRLLESAAHPRREVYLFNDLTAHSWASSLPPHPPELAALYVLDVGREENRNVSLGWPQLPDHAVPPGVPAGVAIRLRTGDQPAEPVLEVSLDGHPRLRQTVQSMEPNSQAKVEMTLPPLPTGIHPVTVALEPADALAADNRRFGFLAVGELPEVVVAGESGNEVAALVSAMIAPAAQPRHEHRFAIRQVLPEELTSAELDNALAVILADVERLEPAGREVLESYTAAGGAVLVIPGPRYSPAGYADAYTLLPAPVEGVAEPEEAMTIAASDLSHPYLQPFQDSGIDSINNRRVFRRLLLGAPGPRTSVIARFSDGEPALLEMPVGSGRVILLAFSPARDWGQFGTQAAPTIVLLHTMLTAIAPRLDHVAAWSAGQRILRGVGEASQAMVETPVGSTTLAVQNRQVQVPTEIAGHYRLMSHGDEVGLYYSVNVAEAESSPARIPEPELLALLPRGKTTIATTVEQLPHPLAVASVGFSLLVPLGIGLLTLLLIESLFANRFYSFLALDRPRRTRPADRGAASAEGGTSQSRKPAETHS